MNLVSLIKPFSPIHFHYVSWDTFRQPKIMSLCYCKVRTVLPTGSVIIIAVAADDVSVLPVIIGFCSAQFQMLLSSKGQEYSLLPFRDGY